VQPTFGGGIRDAFVLKVTDTLELVAGGKMRIPASVKLKPTPLGQTVSKFFEIENLSEKKILTGEVGTLTAPFTVDSNGGRFAIQPGKSRRVRIKFTADRLGIITQVLRVTSSDPRAGEVFVLIRGEGLPDR
jgi:hypothetical protein